MAAPPMEEYLAPGFDPAGLRVPQLRSILLAHNIPHPSQVKKADLVQLFIAQVQPRASELLGAAAGVRPNGKGIIEVDRDGQESVIGEKRSRSGGKGKAAEPTEETAPPPPKRPRGRPRKTAPPPEVEVEVEKAEMVVATPIPEEPKRKRGRPRKSEVKHETPSSVQPPSIEQSPIGSSAPPSARRSILPSSSSGTELRTPSIDEPRSIAKKRSEPQIRIMDHLKEEEEAPRTPLRGDEPAFSDFNPFQSGSEDAAERERRRRKSSIGVTKSKPKQPRLSEPVPTSSSGSAATPSILRRVGPSRENLRSPPQNVRDEMQRLSAAEEYNRAVQEKLTQISSRDVEEEPEISTVSKIMPTTSTSLFKPVREQVPSAPARRIVPLSALFLLLLAFVGNWKSQSSQIGYCDAGASTNDIILVRESAISEAHACIDRRARLNSEHPGSGNDIICDASVLPLVPVLPRPVECTPCPPHAVCADGELLACAPEYLLSPHPLAFLSPIADGLPGLGPRAFPPACKPDTAKKRLIGNLATQMERELARGRGLIVCAGQGKEDGRKGEGQRYGLDEAVLRERFAAMRDPKFSREQFDEIFEAALKDLLDHEDVIESIDVELVSEWQKQLGSTAGVVAAIYAVNYMIQKRKKEKYRAEELAKVVLKRLQDQERQHYSDPVTTPQAYVKADQLRDVVIPREAP
ncbi:inner nuclear membrane protein enriched at telomere/subtelomere region [Saitozyma podzolica]|uniref:Inner nuclear membrane protein enriched at telomere/subtelomere region n=1 Tax=Saitozyma podzolica TaxID=1890683 RepID=A0A427YGF6_9TREE|nr:inner nuclear membrane protein enriched at telomere/subtelomere region [Saitozyma podzolica]